MEEIIVKYLNKTYKFTLSTYVSYLLIDRASGKNVRPQEVFDTLHNVFSVEKVELERIYDKWAENQAIKMENLITDIRYRIYEKTGLQLELTVFDLNRLINLEEDQNAEMAEGLMGIVGQNNAIQYRDPDKL